MSYYHHRWRKEGGNLMHSRLTQPRSTSSHTSDPTPARPSPTKEEEAENARLLAECRAQDAALPSTVCSYCKQTIPGGYEEDHTLMCKLAPTTCFLCNMHIPERRQLFKHHLSCGGCAAYAVKCSNWEKRCVPEHDTEYIGSGIGACEHKGTGEVFAVEKESKEEVEEKGGESNSSSNSSSSSSTSASITALSKPNPRNDHRHHNAARWKETRTRFFLDETTNAVPPTEEVKQTLKEQEEKDKAEEAAASSSSSSSSSTTTTAPPIIRLLSCPHCQQRLCVAFSSTSSNIPPLVLPEVISPSPTHPIPFSQHARLAFTWSSHHGIYENAAKRKEIASQEYLYQYPLKDEDLILTEERMKEHMMECEERARKWKKEQEDREREREKEKENASTSSSINIITYSTSPYDDSNSKGTGIFKYQPRIDDIVLSATPATAVGGEESKESSESSASVPASASTTNTPLPTPTLRLTYSQLLLQDILLRHGLRFSLQLPSREQVHEAFIHGGSLSDILAMYDKDGVLLKGMKKMSTYQPGSIDIQKMSDTLAPLQRPLVEPLLDPYLIPDLASMVLDYF